MAEGTGGEIVKRYLESGNMTAALEFLMKLMERTKKQEAR